MRAELRAAVAALAVRGDRIRRALRKTGGELLTMAATLAGWALITWGVASLTSVQAWKFSTGVLLLSSCGWQFLAYIAWRGLYQLTRRRPDA